jgi:hypothetical protein
LSYILLKRKTLAKSEPGRGSNLISVVGGVEGARASRRRMTPEEPSWKGDLRCRSRRQRMLKERGGSERWRERHREAAMDDEGRQRATLTSVRAHEAVAWGTQEFFGGKRIDTCGLIFILLKLSVRVLDENRC